MLKKYFDWTPRDVAAWEKIRAGGLGRFLLRYGLLLSGGLFFIVPLVMTIVDWLRSPGRRIEDLVVRLLAAAVVCLAAGLVNGLVTWWMEEGIYQRKYRG